MMGCVINLKRFFGKCQYLYHHIILVAFCIYATCQPNFNSRYELNALLCLFHQFCEGLPSQLTLHRQLSNIVPPPATESSILLPSPRQGEFIHRKRHRKPQWESQTDLKISNQISACPWLCYLLVRAVRITALRMPRRTASRISWL